MRRSISRMSSRYSATRVRSPDAGGLREALARVGIDAQADGDRLSTSAPAERVGEVAAANGIVLHELMVEAPSLEEAFLELTAGETGR